MMMKKYILAILVVFTASAAQAQFSLNVYWTEQTTMSTNETIYYSAQRPLAWNDFKGKPDNSSVAAAMTASGFGYKADFKSNGPKSQLNIAVYCYFNKNSSWVKPGKNTTYILGHEQQHFDISFIASAIFFEKLKSSGINKSNYNVLLPRIYNESVALMNKMQQEYDGQTKNGQLKEEQARWAAYLDQQLKAITK
jgi:hypothetical protein